MDSPKSARSKACLYGRKRWDALARLLVPVAFARAPSAKLMKSLFDLTPSEARVAKGIVQGDTPEIIAAQGNVAISTVRSQLRRILEKTGCARQADLSALLARLGTTAPDKAITK